MLFTKQFKGSCRICGKIGHKATDCFTLPENKEKKREYMKQRNDKRGKNSRNQKSIQCFHCKAHGHIKRDCPLLKETANLSKEADDYDEVALMCCETASKATTKLEYQFWIADSGASAHMTNDVDGLTDVKRI